MVGLYSICTTVLDLLIVYVLGLLIGKSEIRNFFSGELRANSPMRTVRSEPNIYDMSGHMTGQTECRVRRNLSTRRFRVALQIHTTFACPSEQSSHYIYGSRYSNELLRIIFCPLYIFITKYTNFISSQLKIPQQIIVRLNLHTLGCELLFPIDWIIPTI